MQWKCTDVKTQYIPLSISVQSQLFVTFNKPYEIYPRIMQTTLYSQQWHIQLIWISKIICMSKNWFQLNNHIQRFGKERLR